MSISFQPSLKPRIAVIDILRGFALYGIILAHTGTVYLMESGMESHQLTSMDSLIKTILTQLIEKKFYLIFSFLFGLSFFIQLHNATKKNKPFVFKYIWRLFILFFIGWAHNQFYPFDILQTYAVIGLFLLPLRKLTAHKLLSIACILFLGSIIFHYYSKPIETTVSLWHYNQIQLSQTLAHQMASGNFLAILSLFVLGFWAGKTKKFHASSIDVDFFRRLFFVSLLSTILIKMLISLTTNLPLDTWAYRGIPFYSSLLNICLSALYTSAICLLHKYLPHIKFLWHGLENVGRMGLSNYVAQTLFFFIIFSLGLDFTKGGLVMLLVWAHLFFILQLIYSTIWFKHFKMGSLEWFWRLATNLKWQSNKRTTATSLENENLEKTQEVSFPNLPQ